MGRNYVAGHLGSSILGIEPISGRSIRFTTFLLNFIIVIGWSYEGPGFTGNQCGERSTESLPLTVFGSETRVLFVKYVQFCRHN